MQSTSPQNLPPFGRFAPRALMERILRFTRSAPQSWAGKRSALFMRSWAIYGLRGAPLDVEVMGARMRLFPYNNVCEKRILFTPQYFDEEERQYLQRHITPEFVFLDIGANVGGYSLFVGAHAGPRARILAIEPQPAIFERLIFNIQQNPFATIKAINCAMADRDGEITLFVDRQNQCETSMRRLRSDHDSTIINVPGLSLKSLLAQERITHIDAIKLDVEGAEDLILENFFKDADPSLWPRILLMENSSQGWSIDLHGLIRQMGYTETLRTRSNIAYERQPANPGK